MQPIGAWVSPPVSIRSRVAAMVRRKAPSSEHFPVPDLGGPDEPGAVLVGEPRSGHLGVGCAGLEDVTIQAVRKPMRLGDDADAVELIADNEIARTFLDLVDAATAAQALDAVRGALRSHERVDGVFLNGAGWLVPARRT